MPDDFQHEKAVSALKALRSNEGFKAILNVFNSVYTDLTAFAELQGRNFLVTEKTEPRLYDLYRTAAERLEVSEAVLIYLSFDHKLSAETVGIDGNYAIMISSGCLETFSEEQMLAILGHELTHIRYGHVPLLNMGKLLDVLLGRIPLAGTFAAETLKTLMLEWELSAEYTADRGAAIAVGRIEPVLQNLICSMGGDIEKGIRPLDIDTGSTNEIPDICQFSKIGQAICQMMVKEFIQPFGNIRISELQKWCNSQMCKEHFSYVYYRSSSRFTLEQHADGKVLYLQAKELLEHNVEEGMALLHAAAEKDYPKALTKLARFYLRGKNTLTKNYIWGLSYMRRAALMNDPAGLYGLGICFQNGVGKDFPANQEMADWLFCIAHERGYSGEGKSYSSKGEKEGFPEDKLMSVLRWFGQRYPNDMNRSCRVYFDVWKGKAAKEDPVRLQMIRDYLWIPQKETIYVVEAMESGHSDQEWAGITDYGIYVNSGRGLPRRISWDTFTEGRLTGVDVGNSIEIRLNDRKMMNLKQNGPEYSIPRLLIKLKNLL